jgi:hypothetical protein
MAEAREGVAQNVLNQKLSVQSNNQSVESILHKLEKLSDVRFLYNPQIFSANSTATISVKNESLDIVLDRLLKPLRVDYEMVGNKIILKKNMMLATISNLETRINTLTILGDQTIKGKITDENGQAIPGASIIIKGTTKGTTTDEKGEYSLVVAETATLIISSVGFNKRR